MHTIVTKYRCISILLLALPTIAFAEPLTIIDPLDPAHTLPLDSNGRIDCSQSALGGTDPAHCVDARRVYESQFGKVDLRFSPLMDDVRPHPLNLMRAFITPRGVECVQLSDEKAEACALALDLYKRAPEEMRFELLESLKTGVAPIMMVPLEGGLACSWAKQKRVEYTYCKEQDAFLSKLTFEQRRAHNSRARNILSVVDALQDLKDYCRRKK